MGDPHIKLPPGFVEGVKSFCVLLGSLAFSLLFVWAIASCVAEPVGFDDGGHGGAPGTVTASDSERVIDAHEACMDPASDCRVRGVKLFKLRESPEDSTSFRLTWRRPILPILQRRGVLHPEAVVEYQWAFIPRSWMNADSDASVRSAWDTRIGDTLTVAGDATAGVRVAVRARVVRDSLSSVGAWIRGSWPEPKPPAPPVDTTTAQPPDSTGAPMPPDSTGQPPAGTPTTPATPTNPGPVSGVVLDVDTLLVGWYDLYPRSNGAPLPCAEGRGGVHVPASFTHEGVAWTVDVSPDPGGPLTNSNIHIRCDLGEQVGRLWINGTERAGNTFSARVGSSPPVTVFDGTEAAPVTPPPPPPPPQTTCTTGGTGTAPTVTSTAVTSTPDSGDTYGADELIIITVTFDESVCADGGPKVPINLSESPTGGPEYANYLDGSGSTMLRFVYLVGATDEDTNGIFLYGPDPGGDHGEIVGGTIAATDDGTPVDRTLTDRGNKEGHKVNGGS